MENNIVKISENTLRKIIAESVNRLLKENMNPAAGFAMKPRDLYDALYAIEDKMGRLSKILGMEDYLDYIVQIKNDIVSLMDNAFYGSEEL